MGALTASGRWKYFWVTLPSPVEGSRVIMLSAGYSCRELVSEEYFTGDLGQRKVGVQRGLNGKAVEHPVHQLHGLAQGRATVGVAKSSQVSGLCITQKI